jgi:hypothetical protein
MFRGARDTSAVMDSAPASPDAVEVEVEVEVAVEVFCIVGGSGLE